MAHNVKIRGARPGWSHVVVLLSLFHAVFVFDFTRRSILENSFGFIATTLCMKGAEHLRWG
jgi:hypothetical protein